MAKRTPATGIRLHGKTYELNVQIGGKRHFINLETESFSEAVEKAKEIRANPDLAAPAGLKAEIDRFIAYQVKMKEYTASTARSKTLKLRLLAAFLPSHASAATVTPRQLQSWHDSLLGKVTTSTIHGYMMTARAFFRWAVKPARLRHSQPMDDVKIIKSEGRARESFCTVEQRDRLIKNAPSDDLRFILYCGFHAGLRLNEIIQARPFWFDLHGMRIVLRQTPTMKFKDREERTVPLTKEFAKFLHSYGLREPFMLRPEVEQGKWIYRYDPRKSFMAYTKLQKLKWVTFHTMRHTFASLLVSHDFSIYKVAVWMGDNVDTVQRHYGHLAPDKGGIEKAFSELHADAPSLVAMPGNSPADKRSQA